MKRILVAGLGVAVMLGLLWSRLQSSPFAGRGEAPRATQQAPSFRSLPENVKVRVSRVHDAAQQHVVRAAKPAQPVPAVAAVQQLQGGPLTNGVTAQEQGQTLNQLGEGLDVVHSSEFVSQLAEQAGLDEQKQRRVQAVLDLAATIQPGVDAIDASVQRVEAQENLVRQVVMRLALVLDHETSSLARLQLHSRTRFEPDS